MRKFNLKFVLFATGYPSSYRVCVHHDICTNCTLQICSWWHFFFRFQILTCLFNRLYGLETKFANFFAAFLAGGFFYFYPQLPFLAYCIACTIEISWQRIRRYKRQKFAIIQKIDALPLAKISYPILMGFLFHMRSFYPWQTPTLLQKVMNFVTCRQWVPLYRSTFSHVSI